MVGLNSSIDCRIGVRSSCTPIARTVCPRRLSVVKMSHSMRAPGSTSDAGTFLGTRSLSTSSRTRCLAAGMLHRHPVAAAVEVVHGLHGEQHGELVARLLLGDREAELELLAALDHEREHPVDGVLVDPRP